MTVLGIMVCHFVTSPEGLPVISSPSAATTDASSAADTIAACICYIAVLKLPLGSLMSFAIAAIVAFCWMAAVTSSTDGSGVWPMSISIVISN